MRRYVRAAMARLGLQGTQAFILLDPEVGREPEVDWGTALASIRCGPILASGGRPFWMATCTPLFFMGASSLPWSRII